jgi:hypothetical protein
VFVGHPRGGGLRPRVVIRSIIRVRRHHVRTVVRSGPSLPGPCLRPCTGLCNSAYVPLVTVARGYDESIELAIIFLLAKMM